MKERIAVLMGGHSLERDISLKSGHRVAGALKEKGYRVASIDVDENLVKTLKEERFDLAFLTLHGKYGEDGTVQELLEILEMPYTGSSVLSSILGMNKELSKEFFVKENIPTPKFYALSTGAFKEMGASAALDNVIGKIGFPIVVKPSGQGSALGIKFVNKKEDLTSALIGALSYDDTVILEEYINGTEITASIIGNKETEILPLVEIVPQKEFFDFESMYTKGLTEYFVPARISDESTKKANEIAFKVYNLFDCRGACRVDMIVKDEQIYVLEINTIPGMTDTSLLPMAAKEAGMDFPDLVEKLVGLALNK
ncbi:MAG: D-alanine--D-alanine ligase [Actinobacteria bacterium]|nr:D-alanine--D-alanine ligase [Actinomycetota bacterium]